MAGMDGSDSDGAPVKKDAPGTATEGGGTSDAACGTGGQPCCPYADGRAGGTCDVTSTCSSNPTATSFLCKACGGSGQPCCGTYGNWTCQKGMCNQTPPITCP
jgi:hypothetical protein